MNTFRKALERREIDLNELRMDITDASTIQSLVEALGSANERLVVYALDMLTSAKDVELTPSLSPLLKHPSSEVRRKAILLLRSKGDGTLASEMEHLLQDEDPQVRIEAVHFLCRCDPENQVTRLRGYLSHPDARIQSAAVGCLVEHGRPEDKVLIDEELIQSLISRKGEEGELSRAQTARALGSLNQPSFHPYLRQLMDDSSPLVVKQVIESSGQTKDRQFVPWLLSKLSDKQYRADARSALASFGPRILGTLADHLTDETVHLSIRMNIPRVIIQIPHQQSVDILTANIKHLDPLVKYPAVKALNKLRARYAELHFDERRVDAALIEETQSYYEILHILHLQREAQNSPRAELLSKALSEKLDQNLELIFRLLSLRYPPRDMYGAYHGIVSDKKEIRASAIEFLDNVLGKDLKTHLMPFLDPISPELVIEKGQQLFGLRVEKREEALACLILGRDPWLKACAIYNVTGIDSHRNC